MEIGAAGGGIAHRIEPGIDLYLQRRRIPGRHRQHIGTQALVEPRDLGYGEVGGCGQADAPQRRGHHQWRIARDGPGLLSGAEVGGAIAAEHGAGRTGQGHGVKHLGAIALGIAPHQVAAAGLGAPGQQLLKGAATPLRSAADLSGRQTAGQTG